MNPRVLYRAATYAADARSTADAVISALSPAAWYRNATGVTEAGGFASQWDDYSGNARHLVQATGTKQPAYAAGVLTFDGVDNSMVAASWSQTQPETIYVVLKMVTWTLNDYMMDGTSGSAALIQNPTTPSFLANANSNFGTNANLAVGSFGIVCYVLNGVSGSTRVNNTAKVTGSSGASNMGGFTLGSYLDGNSNPGNIAVQEVVIFGAAHNDATQSSVITALNNALTVF